MKDIVISGMEDRLEATVEDGKGSTERSEGFTARYPDSTGRSDHSQSEGGGVRDSNRDRSKRLRIFKNGDFSFGGKQVIINGRSTKTLEVLLSQLTRQLDVNVAVKSLHTPTHGRKITSIEQLRDKEDYVAVHSGAFKKIKLVALTCELSMLTQNCTYKQQWLIVIEYFGIKICRFFGF